MVYRKSNETQSFHIDTVEGVIKRLKRKIERACGQSNTLTIEMLDELRNMIESAAVDGATAYRHIGMQTVIIDYLINEYLNESLSEDDMDDICNVLASPGGLNDLYVRILHLIGGSGQLLKTTKVANTGSH